MPTLITFRVNVPSESTSTYDRDPRVCTAEVGTATTWETAPVAMTTLAVEPVNNPVADDGSATTTG